MQTAPATAAPPRCAWCGAELDEGASDLAGRLACPRCGTATTHPWPTDAELDAAYAGWYRPDGGRFSGPGDALLRRSRGRLASRLDEIAPPGRVLDVGSGDGALLDALKASGRDALGLEREATHPDARSGGLETVGGQFAAVVLWHSLEHLPSPRTALERAAALLIRDGVLVVAIPNAGSLQAQVFGDRWFALDIPRHLVHVPAKTLASTLRELGLKVERVSHVRGGQAVFGWLHGLVGSLPGRPDLYDAIRRPAARRDRMPFVRRLATLAAATVLLPVALAATALEVALRRGGSFYVEARRG